MESLQELTNFLSNGIIRDPHTASYYPRLGDRNPHLKLQSLLSQERVKLRTSPLPGTFTGPSEQKPIKNFGEKAAWAYPGTALLSQEPVKLRTSNFVRTFTIGTTAR